jgi:hypothetical protein
MELQTGSSTTTLNIKQKNIKIKKSKDKNIQNSLQTLKSF